MPDPIDPSAQGATDVMEKPSVSVDTPWNVLLWNDPVNLTDYVTVTLVRVLDVEVEAAERLMLLAHMNGKAAVKAGSKEKCQQVAAALMAATLWATMEKVS